MEYLVGFIVGTVTMLIILISLLKYYSKPKYVQKLERITEDLKDCLNLLKLKRKAEANASKNNKEGEE